jgi:L-alanine-DL-glutamate epimerase-like enolase superfamily enzyme
MTVPAKGVTANVGLIPFKLTQAVGGSGVSAVDVIVVELTDADGARGLGFSYVIGGHGDVAFKAAQDQIARFVDGQILPPPAALWRKINASFNRTGAGPNLIALAAIDVAAWDLHARKSGLPLGVAMGGELRPVAVYGSGGFNTMQPPEAAAQIAAEQAARGLTAVKPRVKGMPSDAAVLAAVREALPAHVQIMADANEKCDLTQALWLMALARDHRLLFVEEPLPAHALEGYRRLAPAGAAIATGEHLQTRADFLPFISERIASVIQPDLAMVGGLTPVLEIATLADSFDAIVSPHFLPGLFAHVAAAAPALRWLEEFPLLEPLFEGWPAVDANGTMVASSAAGHGLTLADRFRKDLVPAR